MVPQMFSIYLGNWTLQEEFDDIARQFENHPHIRLVLRVEENLTHNIFWSCGHLCDPIHV